MEACSPLAAVYDSRRPFAVSGKREAASTFRLPGIASTLVALLEPSALHPEMLQQFSDVSRRRVRVFHFSSWAGNLEETNAFLQRLPALDVSARVSDPSDPALLQMARLDCDWHAEVSRALAVMNHPRIDFLPSRVLGVQGLVDLAKANRASEEDWWLVFEGQSPQKLAGALGKLLPVFRRNGVRVLYYAFDDASHTMPCFLEIAPHLSALLHDEHPLADKAESALTPGCIRICRSWVANLVPFVAPFDSQPEEKIVFLGSKLGLTEHRKRQIAYLEKRFGDRFLAIHDHSIPVAELAKLNRNKVSFCPEGRKFATPTMSINHTDRPFWSGCLGMVPVSEDSAKGGRLESLTEANLIVRYSHANLEELGLACERALAFSTEARRKIYDHFNRRETIGTVIAELIALM